MRERPEVKRRHRRVLSNGQRQREPLGDAIRGEISDPAPKAVPRTRLLVGFTSEADRSAGDRLQPVDGAHQLRLAATDEAGDPGDLPRAGMKVRARDGAAFEGQVLAHPRRSRRGYA